jgi:hypothetical protein
MSQGVIADAIVAGAKKAAISSAVGQDLAPLPYADRQPYISRLRQGV